MKNSAQSDTISLHKEFENIPVKFKDDMERIISWCELLDRENLVILELNGRKYVNLLIRSYMTKRPLAKVNSGQNRTKGPWLYLNAHELRQLAPSAIPALNRHSMRDLWKTNRPALIYLEEATDALLAALTEAYREANGRLNGNEEPEPPISDNS